MAEIAEAVNLKELREKFSLTQSQFADKLGITRELLGQMERGQKSISKATNILLKDFLGENKVPEEVDSYDYQKVRNNKKLQSTRKNEIPFYDAEAAGGLAANDMTPINAPAGTIDVGDLLSDSNSAIRIYGNSMLPNYPPGCVVGLVEIKGSFIQPGEVYVIETDNERMLKRIFYREDDTNSDFITCYSDNTMKFDGGARNGRLAYPPFDLPKAEIKKMFIVTGVIKRNTNSLIMNRNNS